MIVDLKRVLSLSALFLIIFVAVALVAISLGAAPIGFRKAISILATSGGSQAERTILLELRLPRVLLGAVVGAALSVSGGVFQTLFRNPLAAPYILGVSSGAGFMAVVAMALGVASGPLGFHGVSLFAFGGGLISIIVLYAVARLRGEFSTFTVLLTGVILSSFFGALLMLVITLFPVVFQRGALFWLMGDLSLARLEDVGAISLYVLVAFAIIYYHSRPLNLLALGDEPAHHLGVEVGRVRNRMLVAASLMTAAVVSITGVVGFVGLIVPHGVRLLFGSDHRLLFPLAALTGASFMVLADTVARVAMAPAELPVGVITALCGSPFFIYLLLRGHGRRFFQ